MMVDVPEKSLSHDGHPYSMTSAYSPDPGEFSFALRGSAGPCHMLDHVWYDSGRFRCEAMNADV